MEQTLRPASSRIEELAGLPEPVRVQAAALGLCGLCIPGEYGGLGLSLAEAVPILEEVGQAHSALRVFLSATTGAPARILARHAREELRKTWLPKLAAGRALAALAVSEPQAGSDLSGLSCRASSLGTPGHWLLDGVKSPVSSGGRADLLLVLAVTEPGAALSERFTLFGLPTGQARGVTLLEEWSTAASRAHRLGSFRLERAAVRPEQVLGEPGRGLAMLLEGLAHGRILLAAAGLGLARRALELALERARTRSSGRGRLADRPVVAGNLAEAATDLAAGRALLRSAARRVDDLLADRVGDALSVASAAKAWCTERAWKIADLAVQIQGRDAVGGGSEPARLLAEARLLRLAEGPTELLWQTVARQLRKEGLDWIDWP